MAQFSPPNQLQIEHNVKILHANATHLSTAIGADSDKLALPFQLDQCEPLYAFTLSRIAFHQTNLATEDILDSEMPPETLLFQTPDENAEQVIQFLQQSVKNTRLIAQFLNVTLPTPQNMPAHSANAHLCNQLIHVNLTLHTLLTHKVSPAAVYESMRQSIYYALGILRQINPNSVEPPMPKIKTNIRPAQVFALLTKTHKAVISLGSALGTPISAIIIPNGNPKGIRPFDVYLLSQITSAGLSRIYLRHSQKRIVDQHLHHYSGYKTPSQVYQQATYLALLLNQLNQAVETSRHDQN